MSNIPASGKTPDKAINSAASAVSITFLTALQDLATSYGVKLAGKYTQTSKALVGDAYSGSFDINP